MMDALHKRFGSLLSELAHLYVANAERRKKLEELIQVNDELTVFYQKLENFIDAGMENNHFKSNVPKKQILFMVANIIESLDDGVGFITDNAKRFNIDIEQGAESEKAMIVLANIVVDLLHLQKT